MKDGIAQKLAAKLLQIKAIKLQPANPFLWTSGWKSPIYCDNRKILSYPEVRRFTRDSLAETLLSEFGKPDVIAGVATGAIAHGVLVAEKMNKPFIYVRTETKSYGMKNMIEGVLVSGHSVVIIEDLISTGQSSLNAVIAVKRAGGVVKGLISVFNYGFDSADKAFKNASCRYTSLCDYQTLLDAALASGSITKEELVILKQWRENPAEWKPR